MSQHYKKDLIWASLGMIFITLFLFVTNPYNLSVVPLLLLPVLVSFTSFMSVRLTLSLFLGWSTKRASKISAAISTGPAIVMMLGSLGQLGTQDFGLAVLLMAGLSWYVRRSQLIPVNETVHD